MAKEIQYYFELRQNVDNVMSISGQRYSDAASSKYVAGKVDLTVSQEALDLGEVTSQGWAIFQNETSSAGNIDILVGSSGTAFCTLRPGECFPIPLSGDFTPYAKTDSAETTATLSYKIFSR